MQPRPESRRAPCAQPANDALMWNRGLARLDLLPASVKLRDLVRFNDDWLAVQRRELGDQLRHGHTKFSGASLQHIGRPFIDFDLDACAHIDRILPNALDR